MPFSEDVIYNKNVMENEKKSIADIENIRSRLLQAKSFDKLANFYSLFADSTRLTIICLLMHNELCVNDIAAVLEVSQSVVSHQLQILRKHDIVDFRKEGKSVFYHLSDNHIKDLFSTGLEHVSEKDEELYQDKKQKDR